MKMKNIKFINLKTLSHYLYENNKNQNKVYLFIYLFLMDEDLIINKKLINKHQNFISFLNYEKKFYSLFIFIQKEYNNKKKLRLIF